MPCFSPLKAFKKHGGGISFHRRDGFVDLPVDLPCGQCIGCRMAKGREWAMRCVHEAQMHDTSCFVTLTYDEKHLPDDGGLHIKDWQLFAKRLRKKVGRFRFFMCGEYGDENLRPHFHACLFGVDFISDRSLWKRERGNDLFISPTLGGVWQLGFSTIGSLTYESAAYVARYVLKKVTGDQAASHYERVDGETGEVHQVRPEFVSMSRRPGLGSDWFDRYKGDVFPRDEVVIKGRRFRPPRFYDSKLTDDELASVKARRLAKVGERLDDLSPDRLAVREVVAARSLDVFKREL